MPSILDNVGGILEGGGATGFTNRVILHNHLTNTESTKEFTPEEQRRVFKKLCAKYVPQEEKKAVQKALLRNPKLNKGALNAVKLKGTREGERKAFEKIKDNTDHYVRKDHTLKGESHTNYTVKADTTAKNFDGSSSWIRGVKALPNGLVQVSLNGKWYTYKANNGQLGRFLRGESMGRQISKIRYGLLGSSLQRIEI